MNTSQHAFLFDDPDSRSRSGVLSVVHAAASGTSSFDMSLFQGFTSMRALTYTSSIPMILRLLRDNDFERFECVFGHGGILSRATEDILSFQAVVDEYLTAGFLGTEGITSDRREIIYERVAKGEVRFFVVKDAISLCSLCSTVPATAAKLVWLRRSCNPCSPTLASSKLNISPVATSAACSKRTSDSP